MTALDIVYMVKASEANEPLRHSLRSLANLPHGRVWLVGYKPRWVRNVEYIPTLQRGRKHNNTWRNWVAMAGSTELPERWVLFNDDFYVTRPVGEIPNLNRGGLDAAITWLRTVRSDHYRVRMEATRRALRRAQRPEPFYSYELHAPMVMERAIHTESVRWLLANRVASPDGMAKRSFYGNWAQAGGESVADVKIQRAEQALPQAAGVPFLSTSDASWRGLAGGWVRRTFAVPSDYEAQPGEVLWKPPANERRTRHGRH